MIFFDFDGVLFDTVKEAYAVSTIANKQYDYIEQINFNSLHYQNFRKLRYLISPAWNYKYLLKSLELNKDLFIIKAYFLNNIKKANKLDYKEFEKSFFDTRNYLKNNFYEKWLNLNTPFEFLNDIKFLFDEFKNFIYIVTTKDKATVLNLLIIENIKFDEDRVLDKEEYSKFGNKKDIINNIIYGDNNIFIDDSEKHIKDCSDIIGLKCFKPNWGYVDLSTKTSTKENILKAIIEIISRR